MTEQYYALVVENIKAEAQLLFRQNGKDGFAVRIEDESDELFWRPLIETALPNKALTFFPYFSKQNDYKTYMKTHSFKTLAQSNPQMFRHLFYQRIVQNIQIAFQN